MKLEEACEIISGGTPSTLNNDYWNGDIAWATPTDITNLNGQIIITKTKRKITKKGLQSSSAAILPKGSVLVTTRATIGYCAINRIPIATNQGFKSLICKKGIHNYFVYYLINFLRPKLESLAGGSTFKEISKNSIRLLKILIPPHNEQIKISEILKSIDYSLQKQKKILLKFEKLKQGLFQQLLSKGIGHTEFKETTLGRIPKEWEVGKIEDVTEVVRGASPRPARDPRYFGGEIPWINVGDLTKDANIYLNSVPRYLTNEGKERSRYIPKDTLLLTNSGNTLGIPKITEIAGCINDGIVAFLNINYNLKKFLYYFLFSITMKLRNIKQGAAQPNLNTQIIKDIIFPLPKVNEMKRITDIFEAVDSQIIIEIKIKKVLELLKKGIMQQLLTGKIRVKV